MTSTTAAVRPNWTFDTFIMLIAMVGLWAVAFFFGPAALRERGISLDEEQLRLLFLALAMALVLAAQKGKLIRFTLYERAPGASWVWGGALVFAFLLWLFFLVLETALKVPPEPAMQDYKKSVAAGGAALAIAVVMTCLVTPIVEELVFRQLMVDAFQPETGRRMFFLVGTLTSLAFSVAHCQYVNLSSYAWLFCVGWLCYAGRFLSGGIALPILIHLTVNAIPSISIYVRSLSN